jgi:hypothetical protein
MAQLISPKTGELISVNSKEFSSLIADPKYQKTILSSALSPISPGMVSPSGTPPSPSSSLQGYSLPQTKTLPPLSPRSGTSNLPPSSKSVNFAPIPTLQETVKHTNQPSKREKLENMNEEEGRGIKTRGWASRSPTRGAERHQLKKDCGNKCFLLPGEEKFPICQSPRMTGGVSNCTPDCTGIESAYIRARQYKYDDVAEKAKVLLKECNSEGLKNFVPSPSKSPRSHSPRMPSSAMRGGRSTEYNWDGNRDWDGNRNRDWDGNRNRDWDGNRNHDWDGNRNREWNGNRERNWEEKAREYNWNGEKHGQEHDERRGRSPERHLPERRLPERDQRGRQEQSPDRKRDMEYMSYQKSKTEKSK